MATRKKKLPLKQMREYIHSLRGSLKRKPGEKSVVQELLEERRAEREREDREFKSVGKETGIDLKTSLRARTRRGCSTGFFGH